MTVRKKILLVSIFTCLLFISSNDSVSATCDDPECDKIQWHVCVPKDSSYTNLPCYEDSVMCRWGTRINTGDPCTGCSSGDCEWRFYGDYSCECGDCCYGGGGSDSWENSPVFIQIEGLNLEDMDGGEFNNSLSCLSSIILLISPD